jgi:hypothetical protein
VKLKSSTSLAINVLPTVLVSLIYYIFLGYRRDYLGHYAAGYGGTLCASAVLLAIIPERFFRQFAGPSIFICTLVCIAAGTVSEATVFRLAKFDEVDYCNQNLGAILAGLAALYFAGNSKPSDAALRVLIIVGVVFLVLGGYFATT